MRGRSLRSSRRPTCRYRRGTRSTEAGLACHVTSAPPAALTRTAAPLARRGFVAPSSPVGVRRAPNTSGTRGRSMVASCEPDRRRIRPMPSEPAPRRRSGLIAHTCRPTPASPYATAPPTPAPAQRPAARRREPCRLCRAPPRGRPGRRRGVRRTGGSGCHAVALVNWRRRGVRLQP